MYDENGACPHQGKDSRNACGFGRRNEWSLFLQRELVWLRRCRLYGGAVVSDSIEIVSVDRRNASRFAAVVCNARVASVVQRRREICPFRCRMRLLFGALSDVRPRRGSRRFPQWLGTRQGIEYATRHRRPRRGCLARRYTRDMR